MNESIEEIAFNSYLAGLFDGEGTFHMLQGGKNKVISCRAAIQLRCDDWRLLEECRARCGHIGTMQYSPSYNVNSPNGGIAWYIHRTDESQHLAARLRNGTGLLSKKARDFEIWSAAIDLLATSGGGSKSTARGELELLRAELSRVKVYDPTLAEGSQDIDKASLRRPEWASTPRWKKTDPKLREEICRRYAQGGVTQVSLAKEFGLTQTYISYIVNAR